MKEELKKIISWPKEHLWRRIFSPAWRVYLRPVVFAAFFCLALLFFLLPRDSHQVKVYFFNVGQGDGSLIRVGDFNLLIDGGPDNKIVEKLGQALPFYDHTIDLMLLTHPHADHLTGQIEVLRRYQVKKVLATGVAHTTDEYLTWLKEIKKQGIEMEIAKAGMIFNFAPLSGDSTAPPRLEILYPFQDLSGQSAAGRENQSGGLNDTSIVARFSYGQTDFFFMGDVSVQVEQSLISSHSIVRSQRFMNDGLLAGGSRVLKVGHHGSRFSSSEDFLQDLRPDIAVIQVGKNSFGHPAAITLDNLKKFGARIFRNDQDGDIVLASDGVLVKRIN